MFNHIISATVWCSLELADVYVSDDADPVPRQQTNGIHKATKTSGAAKDLRTMGQEACATCACVIRINLQLHIPLCVTLNN